MRGKTKFVKSGRIALGIITELVMVVFLLTVAWGLCWLFTIMIAQP